MAASKWYSLLRASLLVVLGGATPARSQTVSLDTLPAWQSPSDRAGTTCATFGDLDADGDLDLILGSAAREPTTAYENVAGELSTVPFWSSRFDTTQSVAAGDVDRDGDTDIVLGNWSGPCRLYLSESGRPNLDPSWSSDRLDRTMGVALADIDGNGFLDILCANLGQPATLHLNSAGLMAPSPSWTSATLLSAHCVAVGDLDRDGDVDCVFGTQDSSWVWFRNDAGSLGKSPVHASSIPDWTQSIALGDVDGDGDLDLVCGGASGLSMYSNIGSSLDVLPAWRSLSAEPVASVSLGDLDNDGDLDLLAVRSAASVAPGTKLVYENSSGSFASVPSISFGNGQGSRQGTLADIDGDGDLDIVSANYSQNSSLYSNETPVVATQPSWFSGASASTVNVALADIGGDGYPELALANGTQGVALHANQAGTLSASPVWTFPSTGNASAVAFGDVDGDGDLDLACGNWARPCLLFENANGVLSAAPVWASRSADFTGSVAWADVDDDGDVDLICGNHGRSRVYENVGGRLNEDAAWTCPDSVETNSVAVGDVDGDLRVDVALGNTGEPCELFLGAGETFADQPSWRSNRADPTSGIALGDIDGDGDVDLVCGNKSTSRRNTLYANRNARLDRSPIWLSNSPDSTVGVALGDLDADGYLDFVCGNRLVPSTIYVNDRGVLPVQPNWRSSRTDMTLGIAVADVDLDGDLDVICGNSGMRATVYPGVRNPSFRGDPLDPRNQLANTPAFLRDLRASMQPAIDEVTLSFTAVDAESDPIWVVLEYQIEGNAEWHTADLVDGTDVDALEASPVGSRHEVRWDVSRLPNSLLPIIARLRVNSPPVSAGVQQVVSQHTINLGRVQVNRPRLAMSSSEISFPVVTVGDTVATIVEIANRGTDTLHFAITQIPPMVRVDATEIVLSPGQSVDVSSHLEAAEPGRSTHKLWFSSDDPFVPSGSIDVMLDIRSLEVRTSLLPRSDPLPLGEPVTILVEPLADVVIERGWVCIQPGIAADSLTLPLAAIGSAFEAHVDGDQVREGEFRYWVRVENSGYTRRDPREEHSHYTRTVRQPGSLASRVTGTPEENHELMIEALLPPGSDYLAGTLYYRAGGRAPFSGVPLDDRVPPSATIPAVVVGPTGIEYYVEVRTVTSLLRDPPAAPDSVHVQRVTFRDLVEQDSHHGMRYRIGTIPADYGSGFDGTLDTVLRQRDEFGPYDITRWRAFFFDAGAGVNVELDPTVATSYRVQPGQAFWLVNRDEHRLGTSELPATSTSTATDYAITLAPGWNQFGNPFPFPVDRSSIVLPDSVEDLVAFDSSKGLRGDYADSPPERLDVFEGVFVYNGTGRPRILHVKPISAAAVPVTASSAPNRGRVPSPSEHEWRLVLQARGEEAEDRTNAVGVQAGASDERDALDGREPPTLPGHWVRLWFPHPDWQAWSGEYRRDVRDSQSDGHQWTFEVRSDRVGEPIDIAVLPEQPLPDQVVASLVDPRLSVVTGPCFVGRDPLEYRIISRGPDRSYELILVAGSRPYVEAQSVVRQAIPTSLSFELAAPNPFRLATRFAFGIPTPVPISLEVFDARGRRVATLLSGEPRLPGMHSLVWDGTDTSGARLSSGVYFARLTTPTGTRVARVVMLR